MVVPQNSVCWFAGASRRSDRALLAAARATSANAIRRDEPKSPQAGTRRRPGRFSRRLAKREIALAQTEMQNDAPAGRRDVPRCREALVAERPRAPTPRFPAINLRLGRARGSSPATKAGFQLRRDVVDQVALSVSRDDRRARHRAGSDRTYVRLQSHARAGTLVANRRTSVVHIDPGSGRGRGMSK